MVLWYKLNLLKLFTFQKIQMDVTLVHIEIFKYVYNLIVVIFVQLHLNVDGVHQLKDVYLVI